jgi:hypothetical protein
LAYRLRDALAKSSEPEVVVELVERLPAECLSLGHRLGLATGDGVRRSADCLYWRSAEVPIAVRPEASWLLELELAVTLHFRAQQSGAFKHFDLANRDRCKSDDP